LLTTVMYNASVNEYSFVGESGSISMVARLPATFPGVGRYGDQVVRRVSFYTQAGKDGQDELVLSQQPMLLDTSGSVEAYTIPLAKDVAEFTLEYMDPQKRQWVDQWITTNQLPKMVRVILGLGRTQKTGSKAQDVVAKIVALPANAVTPDLQVGMVGRGAMQTNRLNNRLDGRTDPRFDNLRQGGGGVIQKGGFQ